MAEQVALCGDSAGTTFILVSLFSLFVSCEFQIAKSLHNVFHFCFVKKNFNHIDDVKQVVALL
jgi:hypothetical protein